MNLSPRIKYFSNQGRRRDQRKHSSPVDTWNETTLVRSGDEGLTHISGDVHGPPQPRSFFGYESVPTRGRGGIEFKAGPSTGHYCFIPTSHAVDIDSPTTRYNRSSLRLPTPVQIEYDLREIGGGRSVRTHKLYSIDKRRRRRIE